MISLLLVWFTSWEIVDIVVGLGIAVFILYSAYELISDGVLMLLDRAVDDEIVQQIVNLINNDQTITSYHFLKTRLSALDIFVDVHLVFDRQISLLEAHKCSDNIELQITQIDDKYNWTITVHLDPYDDSIEHEEEIRQKQQTT
jgi:divalent metal cation (Fe/Co/Zn/Cd) transporter